MAVVVVAIVAIWFTKALTRTSQTRTSSKATRGNRKKRERKRGSATERS